MGDLRVSYILPLLQAAPSRTSHNERAAAETQTHSWGTAHRQLQMTQGDAVHRCCSFSAETAMIFTPAADPDSRPLSTSMLSQLYSCNIHVSCGVWPTSDNHLWVGVAVVAEQPALCAGQVQCKVLDQEGGDVDAAHQGCL